jgi:hypothetical protein
VLRSSPGGFFFVLKRTLVFIFMLALSGLAAAQNSKFTIFAGYSYGNTNYGDSSRSNLNGWEASIEGYRKRPWLTFVADGSGYYGWNSFPISCVTVPVCTPAIPDSRIKQYILMGGPQFSTFRGNFRLFAHAMGGASRATAKTTGFFASSWGYAVAGGGGVDWKWRGPLSIRVSGDYIRLDLFNTSQNMYRASTGFVLHF